MQYVHGSSIRDLIAEAAPLPLEWVAAIGLQIAAVLACAHRVSLIHRDLKPSNLLLTRDGAVKVIDFGVAALGVDAALSTLTPAGVIVGTANYQAPERMLGLYSPRSDLYSLGCVLRELAPDVDPLIDELTAHNPDDRPASAVDVITRLLPLLGTPPPLPAFTHRNADAANLTRAFLALINSSASVAPSPVPTDLRRVRAQVDRLMTADQHSQAVSLLSAAIDVNPDSPLCLDLRRDLARVLFASGNFEQAASALHALIPDLSARLGPSFAHGVSLRLPAWSGGIDVEEGEELGL
jgi:serine/threonine protein kinase